jgi:amino acid transporter
MAVDHQGPGRHPSITPRLGLWDAVSIIVGIVVGTAIFKTPAMVFQNAPGPWSAMAVWLLGGGLSLCGGLCYAELATRYPRDGGDYEYLSRAYGRWIGFHFGWAQLTVILSGSIGAMAYAFADYSARLWPSLGGHIPWVAAAAVLLLSACNALGVVTGKFVQNILSVAKMSGLAAVAVAGLSAAWQDHPPAMLAPGAQENVRLGLAMVFVLYAYGGWNDAAFVAAEVCDVQRNLPRALWIGIAAITAIYLAVNAAYLTVLGFDAARQSDTPAADVLERSVGAWGSRAVSVLVMISALGAINGMILTGSRVYAVWGADSRAFHWLGGWNQRRVAPVAAVIAQAAITVVLILAVGTQQGQRLFDLSLAGVGLPGLPWDRYWGGFETLVAGTAPVFWSFFLLTGLSVFVLRTTDRTTPRRFSIPLFPLPPMIFCAACVYMLYSSIEYARWLSLLGAAPLAIGAAIYLRTRAGVRVV